MRLDRAATTTTRRLVEWGLLILLIVLGFQQYRVSLGEVQTSSEIAAVKTTLGALRTAVVLADARRRIDGAKAQPWPTDNPFLLMDPIPSNYSGLLTDGVPPVGKWSFDPQCACIGYSPMYPQGLSPTSAAPSLWFRINRSIGQPRIVPSERYIWQSQEID